MIESVKDISYLEWRAAMALKPITFGDLKALIKELDETVDDSAPVLLPGYEDYGFDSLASVCPQSTIKDRDNEDDIYSSGFSILRCAQNQFPFEAVILKSNKYILRMEFRDKMRQERELEYKKMEGDSV